MNAKSSTFALDTGLDLRQLVTTGSILHINGEYDDNAIIESEKNHEMKPLAIIGQPVSDFGELEKSMIDIYDDGFVKKKVLEEGGGFPLHDDNTVTVAYTGYWENISEPFDARPIHKPLVVDLKDSGMLPGLEKAIRSMLVGELSVFLFTHHLMYGEMGVPPRIKPRARCVFYIKLLKSILTPKEGKIDFSEPNMFQRVYCEVQMLLISGKTLFKAKNYTATIQLFNKAVSMLHRCRLADQKEENIQEKLLIKLYSNLAICFTKTKQPQKACIACNELRRLNSLWNNGKALFQNAKALRMLGEFDLAEKRLRKAMTLCNETEELETELKLLLKNKESCNQSKLIVKNVIGPRTELLTDEFKKEVENLIKHFKENDDLCKLVMPTGLNSSEIAYIKEVCIRENLFCNKIKKGMINDDDGNGSKMSSENYYLDKIDEKSINSERSTLDEYYHDYDVDEQVSS